MTRTKGTKVESLLHINITASGYKVAKRKLEGKDYLVFPVTMMVEGVHNGSQGPILHPIEELGKIPAAWNGIPIVLNHPVDEGVAISANTPEVLEESAVGKVFGTYVDIKKLKAKAWIEEAKATIICPDVLEKLKEGEPIEVSVGVFTDYEEEAGEWNNEEYTKVAINHRPDHLALLPDSVGACSLADGCGCGFSVNGEDLVKALKNWNKQGFSISKVQDNSEKGLLEKLQEIREAVYALDSNGVYHYMEEVYDSYLIYSEASSGETKYFKQEYNIANDQVALTGIPIEVEKQITYINVNKEIQSSLNIGGAGVDDSDKIIRTKFKNGGNIMANECTPCIKRKVDELIANSGKWTEGDREFLQALSEEQLTKMAPTIKAEEKLVEKEVQVNVLSEEDKAALATYKAEQKAKHEQLISEIQTNSSKEEWPDVVLNAMSDDNLKRVLKAVTKEKPVDYSLGGFVEELQVNSNEEEVLFPTGFGAKTK